MKNSERSNVDTKIRSFEDNKKTQARAWVLS